MGQVKVRDSTSTVQKYITAKQNELVGLTVVTTFEEALFLRPPECGLRSTYFFWPGSAVLLVLFFEALLLILGCDFWFCG